MGKGMTTKVIIEVSGEDEREFAESVLKFAVTTMKSGKYEVDPHFLTAFTGEHREFDTLRAFITKEAVSSGANVQSDFDKVDPSDVEGGDWVSKDIKSGKKNLKRKSSFSEKETEEFNDFLKNIFE